MILSLGFTTSKGGNTLAQMFVQSKGNATEQVEMVYEVPEVSDNLDGTKQLTFQSVLLEDNAIVFDMLIEDNIIIIDENDFLDQRYVIIEVEKKYEKGTYYKNIVADHLFLASLSKNVVEDTIKGDITLKDAFTHALKGSGFTCSIQKDIENKTVKLDEFGKKKSQDLVNENIENYGVELNVDNTHIYVGTDPKNTINYQIDTRANLNAISVKSSMAESYTRITGYGKTKEEKDISSGQSVNYDSISSKWKTNSSWNTKYAEDVGQTFSFKFKGTGFGIQAIKEKLGGKIKFTIDKKTNKTISLYKDTGSKDYEKEDVDVIRGLEDKEHTVVATFIGKDSKNPNTKKMKTGFRVSIPNGSFINLFRTFKDNEKYMFPPVTYVHPDEKLFLLDGRPRVAEAITEDSVTKKEDMEKLLKDKVNPYPQITIEIDFEVYYDPKLEGKEDQIRKGVTIPVLADTAHGTLYEGTVRVQEIKYNPLDKYSKPTVTLTNYRKDILDYQIQQKREMRQQKKSIEAQLSSFKSTLSNSSNVSTSQMKEISAAISQTVSLQYNSSNKTWILSDTSIDGTVNVSIEDNFIEIDMPDYEIVSRKFNSNVDFDMKVAGFTSGEKIDPTNVSTLQIYLAKSGAKITPIDSSIPNGSEIDVTVYLTT